LKEKVSPAVIAVVVVVVLAIIVFIGMKVFGGGGKSGTDAASQAKYNEMTKNGTAHPPSQADMMKNGPPPGVNMNRNRMPGIRPPGGAPGAGGPPAGAPP